MSCINLSHHRGPGPRIEGVLTAIFIACMTVGLALPAGAQRLLPQSTPIVLVQASAPVEAAMEQAVLRALNDAVDLYPDLRYFAITDVRQEADWALISVLGLAQVHAGNAWTID